MDGIERIKVLASEVKDEAVLEIVNYLISRTDMNEKYLNEEKSLKQMIEFIKNNARKLAKNNMAMIKDETVFGWAIHYWDESNKDLKLDKAEIKQPNNITDDEKLDCEEMTKTPKKEKKSKEWVAEGQLTLF